MGPYDASMSSSGSNSSSSSAGEAPDQIDGLLAGAGYRVRSSELRHVAQRLERLENVMVNAPAEFSQLANDAVSSPASASPPPASAPPTSRHLRPRRHPQVSGLADALLDSVPVVAITGPVSPSRHPHTYATTTLSLPGRQSLASLSAPGLSLSVCSIPVS
ncbi:unnamed protein product [Camellia sinensis]